MRPYRATLLAILALAFFSVPGEAQKKCTKGKPCGNTCIAQNKECHVGTTPSPSSSRPPVATAYGPGEIPKGSTDASQSYVASPNGNTFYLNISSCQSGWKLKSKIYFRSVAEAEAAGYRQSTQKKCQGQVIGSDSTGERGLAGASSAQYVASPDGHTYYRNLPSCKGGQKLKEKLFFETAQEAEAAGFKRSKQGNC